MRLNLSINGSPADRTARPGPGRRAAGALLLAALLVSSPAPRAHAATARPRETVERRVAVMGTMLDVALVGPGRENALAASEEAIAEIRRIEDLLTTWRDSPLDRLNRAPAGAEVALEPELAAILSTVFAWSGRTLGAFDPTVAPLVRAWDLRGAGRVPTLAERAAASRATGTDRFDLDAGRRRAIRRDPSAAIDEGAWGKGYALDRAARQLEGIGIADALLDLGGQVLALGRDAGGAPWRVSVAHPRERDRGVAVLALSNLSASTSGNSERARNVGGRRIGPLLDPRTGEPASDFGAVTVVAPSALVADVLSTALFVLGPREGLTLSKTLRREGVANEALFLVERGAAVEAFASPGFARLIVAADLQMRGVAPAHRERRSLDAP